MLPAQKPSPPRPLCWLTAPHFSLAYWWEVLPIEGEGSPWQRASDLPRKTVTVIERHHIRLRGSRHRNHVHSTTGRGGSGERGSAASITILQLRETIH